MAAIAFLWAFCLAAVFYALGGLHERSRWVRDMARLRSRIRCVLDERDHR